MKRAAATKAGNTAAAPKSLIATVGSALALTVVAAAISGCGHSPPTRYFTLDAVPASAPLSTARMPPVQLSAVHIPAELDRPQVVTKVAPNRLVVSERDRWGAPLAQMMRRTLAQDLMTRLPAGTFVPPDAPAPQDARALVVTVLDAEADEHGTLTLQAAWTLMAGRPALPALMRQVTLKGHAAGRDANAQAAQLSGLLGVLADRIAASLGAR